MRILKESTEIEPNKDLWKYNPVTQVEYRDSADGDKGIKMSYWYKGRVYEPEDDKDGLLEIEVTDRNDTETIMPTTTPNEQPKVIFRKYIKCDGNEYGPNGGKDYEDAMKEFDNVVARYDGKINEDTSIPNVEWVDKDKKKNRTRIDAGQLTYIGADKEDNGKLLVENRGYWNYLIYQKDEFTRMIEGYIVDRRYYEENEDYDLYSYQIYSPKYRCVRIVGDPKSKYFVHTLSSRNVYGVDSVQDGVNLLLDNYDKDKCTVMLESYRKNKINEDTVKQNGKWVNKGKEGTHGKFNTKKGADAQRKAMFANGYHESLNNSISDRYLMTVEDLIAGQTDNMSDEEIDRDITLYNKIGRVFGRQMPDEVVVFVDHDFNYDPKDFSKAGLEEKKKDFEIYSFQDREALDDMLICANRLNGNLYLFFDSEEDANKYLDAVDYQYDGFEEDDSFN